MIMHKCDGCNGTFTKYGLLAFQGNVSAMGGGGFIGNNLVMHEVSQKELATLWLNGDPTIRTELSKKPTRVSVDMPLVFRELRYCRACILRIVEDAFLDLQQDSLRDRS